MSGSSWKLRIGERLEQKSEDIQIPRWKDIAEWKKKKNRIKIMKPNFDYLTNTLDSRPFSFSCSYIDRIWNYICHIFLPLNSFP